MYSILGTNSPVNEPVAVSTPPTPKRGRPPGSGASTSSAAANTAGPSEPAGICYKMSLSHQRYLLNYHQTHISHLAGCIIFG